MPGMALSEPPRYRAAERRPELNRAGMVILGLERLEQFHEIVGYYNRFDVFELKINRARLAPIQFEDETLLQPAAPADATGESV